MKPKLKPKTKAAGETGPYYFEPLPGGRMLVSNDWGGWLALEADEFKAFSSGKLGETHPRRTELAAAGFFSAGLEPAECARKFGALHSSVFSGTTLHIIILTIRCNQKCVYCHASAKGAAEKNFDMDEATARRTVDFIFASSGRKLIIEFQGGEPFLNWPVLRFAVKYAREKAEKLKKTVDFKLVSNLSALDDEKLRFVFENNIGLATSLDGPARLHDAQRVLAGSSAHAQVVR